MTSAKRSQKLFSRYRTLRLPRSEPTSSELPHTKFSAIAKGLLRSQTLTFCQPTMTHPLLTARLEDKPSGVNGDKQLDLQPSLPEGSQWEKELGGGRRSLNSALEAAEEGTRAEGVVQQRDRPGPPKGKTRSNDSTFRPSWRIPQTVRSHWGEPLGTEANPVRASTTMAFQASKAVRFKLPRGDHSPSVRVERDQTLDGQGFVRQASPEQQTILLKRGQVSPAFVTSTAKKLRLVVDYSHINKHLEERTFRMDQLGDLASVLRPQDCLFKADISDAYYHLRLRRCDQELLAFRIWQQVYIPQCLNCGLSVAPWYFTKILKPVIAHLRARGHRIYSYLDDFFGAARSSAQGEGTMEHDTAFLGTELCHLFARISLELHPEKCDFSGRQQL